MTVDLVIIHNSVIITIMCSQTCLIRSPLRLKQRDRYKRVAGLYRSYLSHYKFIGLNTLTVLRDDRLKQVTVKTGLTVSLCPDLRRSVARKYMCLLCGYMYVYYYTGKRMLIAFELN